MNILNHLHHILVPRHSNNYKARLLHSSGIIVVLLFVLLSQSVFQLLITTSPSVLGYAAQIDVSEVIRLTNVERGEQGLPPVTLNDSLADAAYQKGKDMIANDYWAHVSPTGVEPWDFFKNVGYKYRYAGENLARDFSNASAAIDAWMASPSHRENMLSPKYKEIGVAVVEGSLAGQDSTIIVQLFGTQAQDAVSVPVAAAKDVADTVPVLEEPSVPEPGHGEAVVASAQSPFDATRSFSLVIIGFMMFLLIGDIVYISRHNVSRKSSRSFAHLAFFGMIFAILIIIKAGKII